MGICIEFGKQGPRTIDYLYKYLVFCRHLVEGTFKEDQIRPHIHFALILFDSN